MSPGQKFAFVSPSIFWLAFYIYVFICINSLIKKIEDESFTPHVHAGVQVVQVQIPYDLSLSHQNVDIQMQQLYTQQQNLPQPATYPSMV